MAAVKSVTSELASTETNLLSRRAERASGRLDAGGLQPSAAAAPRQTGAAFSDVYSLPRLKRRGHAASGRPGVSPAQRPFPREEEPPVH